MLSLKTLLVFYDLSERKKEYIYNSLKDKNVKSFKEMYPFEYNYCINNMKYYHNNTFCSIR